MDKKFPKRKSIRIPDYDYSKTGIYAVTIDSHQQNHLFGEVKNKKMILNDIGKIAVKCWMEIPNHFSRVTLREYIVMPNHVHGLIAIQNDNDLVAGAACCAPTAGKQSMPIPRSLPVIVRSFKSAVTKAISLTYPAYLSKIWQRGYYERIIRNASELKSVTEYILLNPARWEDSHSEMTSI